MFKFQLECEGETLDVIIDDEGELVFKDYDINEDIIAAELGDEPSECLLLLQAWDVFTETLIETGDYGNLLDGVRGANIPVWEMEDDDIDHYKMDYKEFIDYLVKTFEYRMGREPWTVDMGYSLSIARLIGALPDGDDIDIRLVIEPLKDPEEDFGRVHDDPTSIANIETHKLYVNNSRISTWKMGSEWITTDVEDLCWTAHNMVDTGHDYGHPLKNFPQLLAQFSLEDPVPDFPPHPYVPQTDPDGLWGVELNEFTDPQHTGKNISKTIWYKRRPDALYHYFIVQHIAEEDFFDHSRDEYFLVERERPEYAHQRIALAFPAFVEAKEEVKKWLSSKMS